MDSVRQGTMMKRVGFLIIFSSFIIFLHAMAMSEGNGDAVNNDLSYGFSPDRSRWNNYAIEDDYTIYFYDTKSIIRKNDIVKVWIKFGEPINDNAATRIYKEATALKEINCGTRLIRSVEWNYLSMKGEILNYTSPTKWENIEPETANDALLEVVCPRPRKTRKR